MINLNLALRNPFWNRWDNVWNRAGNTPFKYKFWEAQLMKTNTLIGFGFRFTTRQDHAGVNVEMGFLGYDIDLNFYDSRHWNDEEGKWNEYPG